MSSCRLPRDNRLRSSVTIQRLHENPRVLWSGPLRLLWQVDEKNLSVRFQVGFCVGKRKFPAAVDRNTIKRRMREQFRLRRWRLDESVLYDGCLQLFFVYTARVRVSSQLIGSHMDILFRRLLTQK